MARCTNCGHPGFETECKKCGFKVIPAQTLSPGTLVFCESCGCTFWDKCTNGHPTVPVELNKTQALK